MQVPRLKMPGPTEVVLIAQDSQLVHGKPRVAVKSWSLVSVCPARRQASIEEPLEGPVLPGA